MHVTWQNEMVPLLRSLINDVDSTQKYGESRLQEILVHSSHIVIQEADFDTEYTISITNTSITPDPTTPTRDSEFINLVCLKAACLITFGEMKTLSAQACRIVDGPSSIDISSAYNAAKQVYEHNQLQYDKLLLLYKIGKAGQAVLTPYTNQNVTDDYTFN